MFSEQPEFLLSWIVHFYELLLSSLYSCSYFPVKSNKLSLCSEKDPKVLQ